MKSARSASAGDSFTGAPVATSSGEPVGDEALRSSTAPSSESGFCPVK
jgi:hypothetical protein